MKVNPRLVIFTLVVLAVGAIFVIPYLNNEPSGDAKPGQYGQPSQYGQQGGAPGEEGTGAFKTTPNPDVKLKEALKNKRPVFLEFYSVT